MPSKKLVTNRCSYVNCEQALNKGYARLKTTLQQNTVLVCRAEQQCYQLSQLLLGKGFNPLAFSLIKIVPNQPALKLLPKQSQIADWLVFVSPSAVEIAWSLIDNPTAKLACIGKQSAFYLAKISARNVVFPTNGNDSASLLAEANFNVKAGQKVLIVGGHNGRDELANTLRLRNALVYTAKIYHRAEIQPDWKAFDVAANNGSLYAACVTTSQIASLLFNQAGKQRLATLQSLRYCVPHARIAEFLFQANARHITITEAGDQAMVSALCKRRYSP